MCLTKKKESSVGFNVFTTVYEQTDCLFNRIHSLSSIAILTVKPHIKCSWSAGLNRTVRYLYSAKN